MSREDFRSWSRRKEWMVGEESGVGLIDSLVKTGK